MALQDLPSLIIGDFNYIMRFHEKRGGRQFGGNIEFREFRYFISNVGLIDLGYSSPKFI